MNHLIPDGILEPSGQAIDPLFLFADGLRAHEVCERNAVPHRLVKAPKSPTTAEALETAYKKHKFDFNALRLRECEIEPGGRDVVQSHEFRRTKTEHGTPGTATVIEFREWSEEWRVRTTAECTSGSLPPDQNGERESIMLSERGAKKIAESCEFMHLQNGGFKTFVTGTFSQEKRDEIASGKTTIQKEVSRAMDALQKMYQRGWTTPDGERVAGHSESLPYLWVVEVPKNEEGEDNPHIHMLLGWRVEYRHFKPWAARIEKIWGNGYFHLEKIKDSECAGAYMAKAAGYLTKAQDAPDQGLVRGNRYGISETARAPDWVTVSKEQLHAMGQLIFDVYDHLTVQHGDKYQKRKRLNKALSDTPKNDKAARKRIGEKLAEVRAEIKQIPVRANKYQLVIKGTWNFNRFITWAKTPESNRHLWPDWLPDKPEGEHWQPGRAVTAADGQYLTRLRQKFQFKRFWRRLSPPGWLRELRDNLPYWHSIKADYERDAALFEQREMDGYNFAIL